MPSSIRPQLQLHSYHHCGRNRKYDSANQDCPTKRSLGKLKTQARLGVLPVNIHEHNHGYGGDPDGTFAC